MSFSMYSASIPVFRQLLGSLLAILDKAEAHIEEKKIDPNALLQFRLFPDMLPLRGKSRLRLTLPRGLALAWQGRMCLLMKTLKRPLVN